MYVEDRECGSIVDMTFRGDSHLKSKRKCLQKWMRVGGQGRKLAGICSYFTMGEV